MLVAVALRFQGKIYSLPKPNRHHHIVELILKETGVASVDTDLEDEGFLDENKRFYNRKQGLYHARKNNQIKDESKVRCNLLTSEDIW